MSKCAVWRKLGRLFVPGQYEWMRTHAQNPLPESLGSGFYRVHFAGRDKDNRARGGSFVFDINQPQKILELCERPTLDLGSLGAFDDAGVMPSALIHFRGSKYLYYTGWSRTVDVPFAFHIGLSVSTDDGKTYARASRAPVLGRNHFDPYVTAAPYVLEENGKLRMWYTSCTKWVRPEGEGRPKHYYTVKHATSHDGFDWECSDHLCLNYEDEEYALARPVVWKENGRYVMWFTFRGGTESYRVGIATSVDGITWQRQPQSLGIDVGPDDWDDEMICYAHPIFSDGNCYALYNGNGYGETGIGLAVFE